MPYNKKPDGKVVTFPQTKAQDANTSPQKDGSPRATMICIDSGLDGLTGIFAIDDAGNWIGRDGEVVMYEGEDMADAVARMKMRQ